MRVPYQRFVSILLFVALIALVPPFAASHAADRGRAMSPAAMKAADTDHDAGSAIPSRVVPTERFGRVRPSIVGPAGAARGAEGGEGGEECPAVDLVFVMDTSGSMSDEGVALCNVITDVEAELLAEGIMVDATFLGITQTAFGCLEDTVAGLLGTDVPGNPPCCPTLGNSEDWGPATAIIADRFAWTPGSLRLIVPISDEGARNGDPCDNPGDDSLSIQNAISIANQNDVVVSPITGTGSDDCVNDLAQTLANGTDGVTFASTDPDFDLAGFIVELVNEACAAAAIEVHDPVFRTPGGSYPFLREGATGITPDTGALADLDNPVSGIAADGAARVVLRIPVGGPGTVNIELGADLPSTDGLGSLRRLDGSSDGGSGAVTLQVNAVEVMDGGKSQWYGFAILDAPEDFVRTGEDVGCITRPLPVTVAFTPEGGKELPSVSRELDIHRPAVALLHGIWGDENSWVRPMPEGLDCEEGAMAGGGLWPELDADPRYCALRHSYAATSDQCFQVNAAEPRIAVQSAITKLRNQGVATVQADLIGHSMGGLLGRRYIGGPTFGKLEDYGEGDVNRLVTIGSPHLGSPYANELVDTDGSATFLGGAFELLEGDCVDCGAVLDLRTDATEILNLPAIDVPVHLIWTSGGSDIVNACDDMKTETFGVEQLLALLQDWGMCDDPKDCPSDYTGPGGMPDGIVDSQDLLFVLGNWGDPVGLGGMSTPCLCDGWVLFVAELFFSWDEIFGGDQHDLVVSGSSQRAGDPVGAAGTSAFGYDGDGAPAIHTAQVWDTRVIEEVRGPETTPECGTKSSITALLDVPGSDITVWRPGLEANPGGSGVGPVCGGGSPAGAGEGGGPGLVITAPMEGDTVPAGTSFAVSADVDAGLEVEAVGFVCEGDILVDMEAPFEGELTLSAASIGPSQVLAFANLADGSTIQAVPININVDVPATLLSISFQQEEIFLFDFAPTSTLIVLGEYSDGITRDISGSEFGTTYSTNDETIATVDAEGVISAVAEGFAVVTANNSGRSAAISVEVVSAPGEMSDPTIFVDEAGFVVGGPLDGQRYAGVLMGTEGDDVIQGTDGEDLILGGGGNDDIRGLGGRDNISGGAGDDLIDGGDGNDVIRGNDGNDTILGGPGADVLRGEAGLDQLFGNEGNDILKGGDDDDDLDGGDGDDILEGGAGNDTCIDGEVTTDCEA